MVSTIFRVAQISGLNHHFQAAKSANGRRCPNVAFQAMRYGHQSRMSNNGLRIWVSFNQ